LRKIMRSETSQNRLEGRREKEGDSMLLEEKGNKGKKSGKVTKNRGTNFTKESRRIEVRNRGRESV